MFPTLDQAISQFEGFGQPGTIATRQNNPGDLIYGPFAQSMGATGPGTGNIAIFPNNQTGFAAMDQLIQHYANQGYNIQQLIGAWNPPNAPGNTPQGTQNYTNFVAQQARVTPQTQVSATAQNQQKGSCAWYDFGCKLNQSMGLQPEGSGGVTDSVSKLFPGFSFGRIATIALGLITIAGAIFLFRGGDIIQTVKRVGPLAA